MKPAVIVPVRTGQQAVLHNLLALMDAAGAARVPVYIVDNGIPVPVRNALTGRAGTRVVRCTPPGSYAARNAGVREALAAGHDVLVFTDADCRPVKGWPTHLLGLLDDADIAVSVAAPRKSGLLGRGSSADYTRRLRAWAGGPVVCGDPVGTMDTRACAVRSRVFADQLFDERLSFAGDAHFGRRALRAGRRVVGCHHTLLSHDPPASWWGEYRKYHRIAATLTGELRERPRREVLRLLPEHAHLLLPPPRGHRLSSARGLVRAVCAVLGMRRDGAERLYAAVRELAWGQGWLTGHRRRQGGGVPQAPPEPKTFHAGRSDR